MSKKIYGIALRGTEGGMTRIRDLVQDDLDFEYLEDFQKSEWEARIGNPGDCAGILTQCVTHIPAAYRPKTVLFALGSTNRKIIEKESIRNPLKVAPLREIWVNNNTVAKALEKESGITAKVMYRANQIFIPKECPKRPENRIIAWYASPWNGCLKKHKQLSKQVIDALHHTGIRIFMFPHDSGWSCNQSHILALGKAKLGEIMPTVHGMVRFGELGDFGRANYDFVARGKWVLNYDVDEPFMYSVDPKWTVDNIVDHIRWLVDEEPDEERYDRWMFAKKHLSSEAMKAKWVSELKRVFEV
jgi:hypothetical protein